MTQPAGGPEFPRLRPHLRPQLPGRFSLSLVAFLLVLVPGIAFYAVATALGASLGVRTLLGLLALLVGLAIFPFYLARLGRRLDRQQQTLPRQDDPTAD